jgi:glycosyltransferase involved in cell wall biosynthesis
MRIAQVAPLYEAVSPKLYHGTSRIVSLLAEELVALGHKVTLFASGDSETAGTLVQAWPQSLRSDPTIRDTVAPHMLMMEQVLRQAASFDIIHFHMDYWPLSLFSRQRTPFLTTLHERLDLPESRPIFDLFPSLPFVSISDSQKHDLPGVNFLRTVQYGLPVDLLRPRADIKPEYLAFLGRISAERGPDRAIRIALAAGLPLKIASKATEIDRAYYEAVIRPLLNDGSVELIGELSDAEKAHFLSGAVGLLMPIDRPRPFSLVMIEAMACGTPVISFGCGSAAEIVEEELTGFIVANEAEAVAAVGRLGRFSRSLIRNRFAERFTARRMAADYLMLYHKLAADRTLADMSLRPVVPGNDRGPESRPLKTTLKEAERRPVHAAAPSERAGA